MNHPAAFDMRNEKDIYAELDYADAIGVVAITIAVLVACTVLNTLATWLLGY